MDDTMKESKLGGKKHGMVLIISVGKKGDKDPTKESDPDTKKKASIEELQQEAQSMRDAGEKTSARRFADVADAMGRGPALRQSLIDRFGTEAANALMAQNPEMEGAEGLSELMFEEGRESPDYQEARSDSSYLGDDRKAFMQAMSALTRGKQQVADRNKSAQEMLQQLIADDPTKFFADQRMKDTQMKSMVDPNVQIAENRGGLLSGLSGQTLTLYQGFKSGRF
tara:strand:- start:1631 stop:2305 length:675 start_codon:yes stop_codon:yes gene_type:complete